MTEPKVFIIESLKFQDEAKRYFEGQVIAQILSFSEIETKYFYVRTKKEFIKVLELFDKSNYRYLHISCHGGDGSIWTTLDEISYIELASFLKNIMKGKRLFLSACSVVDIDIAKAVIPKSKCNSIIGPRNDISFRDAVIIWASFYHLMFNDDSNKGGVMSRDKLLRNLKKVVDAFNRDFEYFSISSSDPTGIKRSIIKPEKQFSVQKLRQLIADL